jgi:predicted MPP superfamily phosphohydrolase
MAATLLAAALVAYGYFIEPNRLVVTTATIRIKGLDPAFNGLRIAMIADIHGGSNNVTEEKIREVVKRTNEQDADMVVMLGDYVTEKGGNKAYDESGLVMPVSTIADNLKGLRSRYGTFAVLGNHDGWFNDDRVASELTRVGYRVLQNEVAIVEKDGHRLRILGMKDHLALTKGWVQTSADAKAQLSAAGNGDVIVLQHGPDILPVIAGDYLISPDLRLILAAHTHGGQIRLPIFGAPIVPSGYGQKYVQGHVKDKNVDMFVTSGIGTSVLPFRFMVPPEIAVVTILSDSSQ